jgi:hypothetical protein
VAIIRRLEHMSKENVESIIKKAITDKGFRAKLFQEPTEAAKGFEVTDEELKTIQSLKKDEHGDYTDLTALDAMDPEMAKRALAEPNRAPACYTLFVRCYK